MGPGSFSRCQAGQGGHGGLSACLDARLSARSCCARTAVQARLFTWCMPRLRPASACLCWRPSDKTASDSRLESGGALQAVHQLSPIHSVSASLGATMGGTLPCHARDANAADGASETSGLAARRQQPQQHALGMPGMATRLSILTRHRHNPRRNITSGAVISSPSPRPAPSRSTLFVSRWEMAGCGCNLLASQSRRGANTARQRASLSGRLAGGPRAYLHSFQDF